jgi:hypothetical protein
MKPRHAAAFALVGWYLMVPPLVALEPVNGKCSQDFQTMLELQLSDWSVDDEFDTAKQCEVAKKQLLERSAQNSTEDKLAHEGQLANFCAPLVHFWQLVQATCVSTEDPRLNGN